MRPFRGISASERRRCDAVRVKSSGLCLEDPGRGGTIRQNKCNPAILNQVFGLSQ
jgi:hypothetical protein